MSKRPKRYRVGEGGTTERRGMAKRAGKQIKKEHCGTPDKYMQAIITQTFPSGISFDLILVEGGTFRMGSDENPSENPIHDVRVSDFYISKHQIIQLLWKEIMHGENPSRFKGDHRPVETVSWDKVQIFIRKLNRISQKQFRLPTEAEWEYAARGGRYSQGYEYAGSDKLKQVGWYEENSGRETHDVGLLLANELGIHDMSGNVWEWCEDDYHNNYTGAPDNGTAWIETPERGIHRVVRGGGFFLGAVNCCPSYRYGATPDYRDDFIGFRLVLPLQSVG